MPQSQPYDTLFHGERLLVRTVRLLALTTPCHGLKAHFEVACGCAGEAAYRMLEAFVQQMALKGRRRVQLSIPADPRLTDDEQAALRERAAAEGISMQDAARRAVREYVARGAHRDRVVAAAQRVQDAHADALRRLGE